MIFSFTKMNGSGNDFIVGDNRDRKIRFSTAQIAGLCDRHRGIGADGLMLLVPCASGKADWAWEFFNSDGGAADMCGNGARCFARFVQKMTGRNTDFTFEAGAGIIRASYQGERVKVGLTTPRDLRLDDSISIGNRENKIHSLNTGVPHAVLFVEDADKAMVQSLGSEIRHHAHFAPKGTNANFVQLIGEGGIRVRTFERGVEGETLACGTGVTASALIASRVHHLRSPVKVQVQGGDQLEVSFEEKGGEFTNVHLTGPAEFVFEGRIEV